MAESRFTQTVSPPDAGRYLRLPFDVPAGIERLEVHYGYPRRGGSRAPGAGASAEEAADADNVVDLGILDEAGRVRGWSGSERGEVFITPSAATPGYHAGEIREGRWTLLLGLYRISSPLSISVVVRLTEKRRVLLAGDFHLHTVHSDGDYTPAEVMEFSRRAGLEVIALTDHNSTEQNLAAADGSGLIVIPGMEYTNYRGHASFFFPEPGARFTEDPFCESAEAMIAVFEAARSRGALISINHPMCSTCPWTFGFDGVPFDLVEVWNGIMKLSEMQAIAWWHAQLAAGRRIAAVGGSDTHRHELLRSYGGPTTFVYAAGRSASDVLEGMRAGRSFITFTPAGPRPELTVDEAGIGDEADADGPREGRVRVDRAAAGDLVRVLDREGRQEWRVERAGRFSARFRARPDAGFYRAEGYRELAPGITLLAALTNPVYVGRER